MKRFFFFLLFAAAGCQHYSASQEALVAIQIQDRNGLTETVSEPDRLENYETIDFLHSQPYKKVLRVYKGEGKHHSKITTYHPNGNIWQYLEAEEMRAHGTFREWHSNGQLKIDALVIGGSADVSPGSQQDWLFEGLCQVWDEQGHILAKIPYQKGLLEGTSTYYFPSGLLDRELPFSGNALDGESFEYYPDGNLKSRTQYKKGAKNGASLGFFPSGLNAWVEDYSDGLLRVGTYYDSNGSLYSQVENGGGFQALYEENALKSLIEIRQGRPDGRVQVYSPYGEIQAIYHIKSGLKHGEEIHYFSSTGLTENKQSLLPKLCLNWLENGIHGLVKTWYSNGQLQSQREYCKNVKLGPSLGWYQDGSLMFLEEYEEDRLVKGQYYKKNLRDPVSTVANGSGIATLYDGDGIFLRKVTYFKGKPIDPED